MTWLKAVLGVLLSIVSGGRASRASTGDPLVVLERECMRQAEAILARHVSEYERATKKLESTRSTH